MSFSPSACPVSPFGGMVFIPYGKRVLCISLLIRSYRDLIFFFFSFTCISGQVSLRLRRLGKWCVFTKCSADE